MRQRVLITGGTGFIGRRLVERLRLAYTVRLALRSEREVPQGVESVVVGDIGPDTDWAAALEGVDHVVHLAALVHQMDASKVSDDDYHRINKEGTAQLGRAFAASGAAGRFVFVSSIHAMCSSASRVVTESSQAEPDTPYGKSKKAAEEAIQAICGDGGCSFTILRPCLVYGPGNAGNMERLLKLMRLPVPLPLGAIRNSRSFLYVENFIDVIQLALVHPEAAGETFNVADDHPLSTPGLISALAHAAGRRPRLVSVPLPWLRSGARIGDRLEKLLGRSLPLDTYSLDKLCASLPVSNQKLKDRLGWRPAYTTAQGLAATLGR